MELATMMRIAAVELRVGWQLIRARGNEYSEIALCRVSGLLLLSSSRRLFACFLFLLSSDAAAAALFLSSLFCSSGRRFAPFKNRGEERKKPNTKQKTEHIKAGLKRRRAEPHGELSTTKR
jgi:hypothetical protein